MKLMRKQIIKQREKEEGIVSLARAKRHRKVYSEDRTQPALGGDDCTNDDVLVIASGHECALPPDPSVTRNRSLQRQ